MRRSNGTHRNDVLYYLMRPELLSHPWPQSHRLQQTGAASFKKHCAERG
jgi:hypothetical protein